MGSLAVDIYRGTTRSFTYTFQDASTSVAIDVSSDSFRFMVKRDRDKADSLAVIDLSTTAMSISSSTVAFTLNESQTNLPPFDYWYGLKWKKTSTSAVNMVVSDLFRVKGVAPREI